MNILDVLKPVINRIIQVGGTPCVVGGAVRDFVMGIEPKDYDIEVFDLLQDELIQILSEFGKVDLVGKSFGIIRFVTEGQAFDFSSPRKDNKIAAGHTGFDVTIDPFMSFIDSAKRRDLTMNGLIYDIKNDDVIDPFGGLIDIHRKEIRHISDEQFSEDPLRVLRIMQFAGRFDMGVHKDTNWQCYSLIDNLKEISTDRIWIEWEKWASKSIKPSKGLHFLWISCVSYMWPEIEDLAWTEQDEEHHPEGDVFYHTKWVCDAMADICAREGITGERKTVLMLAALCHDFGKPATTERIEGKDIRAYGHDVAGEEPTKRFLKAIGAPKHLIDRIVPLVVNHMQHVYFKHMLKDPNCNQRTKDKFVRRLSAKVNIEDFVLLAEADHSGRPPIPAHCPEEAQEILQIARALSVHTEPPKPILMGRHLIEMGYVPGKEMGVILKKAYNLQLDGEFTTLQEVMEWLNNDNNS